MVENQTFQAPWKWTEDGRSLHTADGLIAISASATSTCGREGEEYYSCDRHHADSHLYVPKELRPLLETAPEMLAVLKEIFAPLGEGGYLPSCGKIVSDRARAIIAKASINT